jgi:hypothetical protein
MMALAPVRSVMGAANSFGHLRRIAHRRRGVNSLDLRFRCVMAFLPDCPDVGLWRSAEAEDSLARMTSSGHY